MDESRISGDRRKGKENRKHTRFLAEQLTFVKFGSEHEENIGQLLDISRSGISIRYFATEEILQDFSNLSIFSSDGDYNSGKIPIKIISDIEREKSPSGKQTLRRYGIQFEKLTPEQTAEMDNFLLNYTLAEA
jgi:urease alpha subunit